MINAARVFNKNNYRYIKVTTTMNSSQELLTEKELRVQLLTLDMEMTDVEVKVFLYFYGQTIFPFFVPLKENLEKFKECYAGMYSNVFEYMERNVKNLPTVFVNKDLLLQEVMSSYVFHSYEDNCVMFSNKVRPPQVDIRGI